MSPKTILAVLLSEEHADAVMRVAVPLARKHRAHLTGLYVMESLTLQPSVSMYFPEAFHAQFNAGQKEAAEKVQTIFEMHTKSEDFAAEWRLLRTGTATPASRILDSTRAADVIVMAQEIRKWDTADHQDEEFRTIRDSGRPVIVVPQEYDGPEIGANILLGWSNTREATRAAHDALALADPGAKLDILRIAAARDELKAHSTLDIAEAFDRHGLKVEVIQRTRGTHSIAEMLLHEAREKGSDLIAVGAFGHSRLYDFALGAVSHELLRSADRPVLYSK